MDEKGSMLRHAGKKSSLKVGLEVSHKEVIVGSSCSMIRATGILRL